MTNAMASGEGQPAGSGVVEIGEASTRREQRFWERYFRYYDTLNQTIPYGRLISRHVELLAPKPSDVVLDAGTGTGNVALALLATGATVVGMDFCEPALRMCREKAPQVEFRFGDLTGRLDFPDASFDKIACCNVIYTLQPEAQRNAVAELARVLKPGGSAAITVFGEKFKALKVYFETIRRQRVEHGFLNAVAFAIKHSVNTARILYYVGRIRRSQKSGDYTFYTERMLTDLLVEGGFEVELVEPIFARQCLIALARKPQTAGASGTEEHE